MDAYLWLKLVHILSATLLVGTGLGTAFFMWTTHRSGDIDAIRVVSRRVVWADWLFTAPAAIIQPATGLAMLHISQRGLDAPWLKWAIGLYAIAALCWLPVVWIQIQVRNIAEHAAVNRQILPDRYYRLMRIWFALGWPAFTAVVIIFYLMTFKPG